MFKLKKVSCARALACLLILMSLLTAFSFAETAQEAPAYMVQEVTDPEAVAASVEEASQASADPEINIAQGLKRIVQSTGFAQSFTEDGFEWRNYAMIAVACLLLYLAIVKQFEPLLLLPIAFGYV